MFRIIRRATTWGIICSLLIAAALGGCGARPAQAPAPAPAAPAPATPAAPAAPAPAAPAPATPAAPPIKIGIIGPMAFTHGDHMWKAALLAQEELEAAGGIQVGDLRRPVQLIKIDTNEIQSVPDATNAVERAITADKVDFLVGGFRSEAVLAMQDVAMDHKTIFMSIGAGEPEITKRVEADYERYKYTFRPNPMNTSYVAQVMFLLLAEVAGTVRRELDVETPRVAVLVEKIRAFEPLVGAIEANLPRMGMEVVGVWQPSATATDVSAELTAIRAAEPHIVFTAITGPVGVVYSRQWEELKIPAASVGVNVEAQGGKFLEATGGKGNYDATINLLGRAAATERAVPFFDEFVARYGEVPLHLAGSYDAVLMLAEAIERAGTLDSETLVGELAQTDFAGITGRIVFNEQHDLTWGPGYVTGFGTQWQDGDLVVFWPNGWQDVRYAGTLPYALPPWMLDHWRR